MNTTTEFINFDDISDRPPLLPTADYDVKLVDPEVRVGKASGNKYISYAVVVQSGEFAGRRVYGMWTLGSDQIWRLKRDLKRLGRLASGTPEEIAAGLEGAEGIVRITTKPGQDGEMDNKVGNWLGTT